MLLLHMLLLLSFWCTDAQQIIIHDLSIFPRTIDFTPKTEDAEIALRFKLEVTAGLQDIAISGTYFTPSQAIFLSPSGKTLTAFLIPSQHLIEGNAKYGTYETFVSVPRWNTDNGVYSLALLMLFSEDSTQGEFGSDDLRNMGFQTTFRVKGAQYDSQTPLLVNIFVDMDHGSDREMHGRNWTPWTDNEFQIDQYDRSIWTDQVKVTFLVIVEENESGLAVTSTDKIQSSYIHLICNQSPHIQSIVKHFDQTNLIPASLSQSLLERLKLSESSSIFQVDVDFGAHTWPGRWFIHQLFLSDEAGNQAQWSLKQLQYVGVSTDTFVRNANLSYDGDDVYDYKPVNHQQILEEYQEHKAME